MEISECETALADMRTRADETEKHLYQLRPKVWQAVQSHGRHDRRVGVMMANLNKLEKTCTYKRMLIAELALSIEQEKTRRAQAVPGL